MDEGALAWTIGPVLEGGEWDGAVLVIHGHSVEETPE
jgi:hypothetical protein